MTFPQRKRVASGLGHQFGHHVGRESWPEQGSRGFGARPSTLMISKSSNGTGGGAPTRCVITTATRSWPSRRAANVKASADSASTQCTSSTTMSSGRRADSLASRLSVAAPTRKRSPEPLAGPPAKSRGQRVRLGLGNRTQTPLKGRQGGQQPRAGQHSLGLDALHVQALPAVRPSLLGQRVDQMCLAASGLTP